MPTMDHREDGRPWMYASVWLLFLAPFFFISYNFSNELASNRQVANIVFEWEHDIPFLPWTILPYWSIDLLYGISLFICTSRMELHNLGKRLLTAQIVAVSCFILFPLGFSFERPETNGLFGSMFTALSAFDQPYNQAPSLHIALLVILWVHFPRHLHKVLIWSFHIMCILIAVSVLTTYQHHFVDLPTGALLGWVCIWLWPDTGVSMLKTRISTEFENKSERTLRHRLGIYYLLAAGTIAALAITIQGWGLWLLWVTVSLFLVSMMYLKIGSSGFQKSKIGQMSLAAKWLLFPYLVGAKINSRLWTRNICSANEIVDGVWVGRFPSRIDIKKHGYKTIIDMTAEFSAPRFLDSEVSWHSISNLDLLTPSSAALREAADLVEHKKKNGPLLIVCALGYSRSALALIAWLLLNKHAKTVDAAINLLREKRPTVVLKESAQTRLHNLLYATTAQGEG
ncbi:MAG: phosphatase PAP2/dual specificity phosphatase family protein [Gammaproteobacteria bacterium]|nr:phosphatase PAP2/dual specificity phosphatase family protein [Gammaproteobacteria bacterium]